MGGFKLFVVFTLAASIGVALATPQDMVARLLQYKELCISMSGSDEGYRQTLDAIPPAKDCQLGMFNVLELQLDAALLSEQKDESWKHFFEKYCPAFNESVSCYDGIIAGAAKCTGDNPEKIESIFTDVAYGIVELVCKNDGQFVFESRKPEFTACVGQLKESVEDCKLTNVTASISVAQYGEDQCREVDSSRQCIKAKIDECNAPALYDLFNVFYNTIMKASSCDQYTNMVMLDVNNIEGNLSDD